MSSYARVAAVAACAGLLMFQTMAGEVAGQAPPTAADARAAAVAPASEQARVADVLGVCCYGDGQCQVTTPEMCASMVGDANCDGQVTFDDISPFVRVLSGGTIAGCPRGNCDCNRDGLVDFDDIRPFVDLFALAAHITGSFDASASSCDPNPCPLPGDTCATARIIPSEPYWDLGQTCEFHDDYDAICPYNRPGSPDVVYKYTPEYDGPRDITLCLAETNYDTKLYVYEGSCDGTPIACNDDACTSPEYPFAYVSRLSLPNFAAGHEYYIVVDGYGGDCGTYYLMLMMPPPCEFECPPNAVPENEACLASTNAGCGADPVAFEPLPCGTTVCGTSYFDGMSAWDTDNYVIEVPPTDFPCVFELEAYAEFDVTVILIRANKPPCEELEMFYDVATPCETATVTTDCLDPGAYYAWIGPQFLAPFTCADGYGRYWLRVECTPCSGE